MLLENLLLIGVAHLRVSGSCKPDAENLSNASSALYVLNNVGHMGQVCGPFLETSNSIDNVGHRIGLGIVSYN